jgi:hypothetical protein
VAEAEAAANLVRSVPPAPDAEPMPRVPAAEYVPVEDDRLEILRALERGDLDVEQAASRLRTLDAAVAGAPEED